MSKELWCIYIAGPDDLVAMPSKAVAEAVARNFNAIWDRYGIERGHDVRAVAHAEPWMHGKEAHTKDLRENFHKYADLVLEESATPSAQPAQPVEAADVRAAFEKWAATEHFILHVRDAKGAASPGKYASFDTQIAWESWQAALAHPRPTGAVALMSVVPGGDPVLQPMEAWKQLSPGNHLLCAAPTGEQAGEVVPYTAEVVAEVVRGDDGQNKLSFVIEGAEAALEVGETLYMIAGLPMPDDGAIDVYLAQPRPTGVPDGVTVDAVRYRKLRAAPLGEPGMPCIAIPKSKRDGTFVNGADADAAIDGIALPDASLLLEHRLAEAIVPFEIAHNVCGPGTEYARGYGDACGDVVKAIRPLLAAAPAPGKGGEA